MTPSRRPPSVSCAVNWTVKVAWHEVQAQWRRDARAVPGHITDRATGDDPARIVEGMLAIAAAVEGLDALSDADRQAILASLGGCGPTEPLSAAEKVRRYRARRRLAAIVEDWDEHRCR
jgi:hypothetical protein